MTETTQHELRDEEIRDLLARASGDAPPAPGWHEVLARHDDRSRRVADGRRRWVVAAAATVVAIGGLGLVVALQSRSGEGGDRRPTDTRSTIASVPVQDPLADLSEDDWAVPAVLPDGYEVIVARQDDSSMPGSLLVGGDDVAEVTISTYPLAARSGDGAVEEVPNPDRSDPTADEVTEATDVVVDVAGIEWSAKAIGEDGVERGFVLERHVNGRGVVLSISGDLEPLVEIAAALRPVPDAALDVPRLSFAGGDYRTVVSMDDIEASAHGVNGVYCLRIEHRDGWGGGSCGGRTEPGTPVVAVGSVGGPGSTVIAGVAEPDVARVEFVTTSGDEIVVDPVDESGAYEERFWITDDPRVGSRSAIERAAITYDDGTTAIAHTASQGWRWTLADTEEHALSSGSIPEPDPNTSAVDGPVMRHPDPADTEIQLAAEVRGILELEGSCLYVRLDDVGERYPIVWPFGTRWDLEQSAVVSPNGAVMTVGDEVYGGGGYFGVDRVSELVGEDAATVAADCVDNAYGEIAIVNNVDDAIGPANS